MQICLAGDLTVHAPKLGNKFVSIHSDNLHRFQNLVNQLCQLSCNFKADVISILMVELE